MTTRQIIRKIVFIALTLAACSGLVVLLVAAIGKRNHEFCKGYQISINCARANPFIREADVKKMLEDGTGGKMKTEPITDFNLRTLEDHLKTNAWVQDANLYFDNREILHVAIREKEPVARIFTTAGRSFYIDSAAARMPVSDLVSARVPVFTNFPDKKFLSTKDSVLLSDVRKTASFIVNDSFWMAQTEQIDISQDHGFDLVPTIGNHIVRLGNADDIEQKFHRLLVFYQQVLSKTGIDRYKVLDVQYAGQVIATKEKVSKVDSMQLRKNVEKLLMEARKMQQDTSLAQLPQTPVSSTTETDEQATGEKATIIHPQSNSNPLKSTNPAKPKLISDKKLEKKPKAVMPEKN